MASCIQAQPSDLSMKASPRPCPCSPSDNIYSKSIALTIKSEAARSEQSLQRGADRPRVNNNADANLFIDLLFVPFILAHSFSLSEEKSWNQ